MVPQLQGQLHKLKALTSKQGRVTTMNPKWNHKKDPAEEKE